MEALQSSSVVTWLATVAAARVAAEQGIENNTAQQLHEDDIRGNEQVQTREGENQIRDVEKPKQTTMQHRSLLESTCRQHQRVRSPSPRPAGLH